MMEKFAKRVHLIGIGGTGLSAIALLLLESGSRVSGSDRQLSPLAESLQRAGVRVFVGHQAENILGAELVIRSSAIPDDNEEVVAALAMGIPVLKRSDFLGQLMTDRVGIAVAGTHGKTTTTAMIAWMLSMLDQDPSFIIGGLSTNLGTNAHAGKGQAFVIEADEYDRMFLGLQPKIAVVTNVEHDHPDCFPTPEEYYQAFTEFTARLAPEGVLIACADDPGAARLMVDTGARDQRVLSYGIESTSSTYRAHNLKANRRGGYTFDLSCSVTGASFDPGLSLALRVPGEHNVSNALAAVAVAHQLGLPVENACRVLEEYKGTGRRFEVRGEAQGRIVIDDYAHHPTEIRATLAAARSRYPDRGLWVVWQPHTYSRTRRLLEAFSTAFEGADHVLITDVYAARETPPADGFSGRQVVEAIQHADKYYQPDFVQAAGYLSEHLQAGDVLLVLSAGDADQISQQVLAALQERSKPHA